MQSDRALAPNPSPPDGVGSGCEPADPRVTRLEALYDAGDFRSLGNVLGELSRDEPGLLRDRAAELGARLELDRFVLGAWVGAALLLFTIIYLFVL